jgi:hypothetical protein
MITPTLYRHARGKNGEHRRPVLLHKDGRIEEVNLSPAFGGVLASSGGKIFHFQHWPRRDAGYPKLRFK